MTTYTQGTWPSGLRTLPMQGFTCGPTNTGHITATFSVPDTPENWNAMRQLAHMGTLGMPGTTTARASGKTADEGRSLGQELVPSAQGRQEAGKGKKRQGAPAAQRTKTDLPAEGEKQAA